VLSGRGLCDELITRPEESCRLWCVVVCDLETSRYALHTHTHIYIYIYDISSLRVNNTVNLPWSFVFSCTQEMEEIITFPCLRVSKNGYRNSKKFHEKKNCVIDKFVFPLYQVSNGVFTSAFIRHYSAFRSELCSF